METWQVIKLLCNIKCSYVENGMVKMEGRPGAGLWWRREAIDWRWNYGVGKEIEFRLEVELRLKVVFEGGEISDGD